MEPIRIILADDHPGIREGLFFLLKKFEDIQIVGEAQDGAEVIQAVDELHPDVVVMDLKMPGMDGVEIIRRLFAQESPPRIIVLSLYITKKVIQELLDLGILGFIDKDEAIEWLVPAIRGSMNGETSLSPLVQRQLQGPGK
jgi:DNA-binding NarL/FixJ family response regulator